MTTALRAATLMSGLALSSAAMAEEFMQIPDQSTFQSTVVGKELRLQGYGPIVVRMTVQPDGAITGRGLGWPVTGDWQWENGYFCRTLDWGGDDLGQNCMVVLVQGETVRFVADQGAGDSADFRLQ